MTAEPFQSILLDQPVSTHRVGAAALVAMLVILAAVAVAVLATAEWIAPISSASVPG